MSAVQYFRPSIMWLTIKTAHCRFSQRISGLNSPFKPQFCNAPYKAIVAALGLATWGGGVWCVLGGRLSDGWISAAGRCGRETRSLPTDTASSVSHQKRQGGRGGGIVQPQLVLGARWGMSQAGHTSPPHLFLLRASPPPPWCVISFRLKKVGNRVFSVPHQFQ